MGCGGVELLRSVLVDVGEGLGGWLMRVMVQVWRESYAPIGRSQMHLQLLKMLCSQLNSAVLPLLLCSALLMGVIGVWYSRLHTHNDAHTQ